MHPAQMSFLNYGTPEFAQALRLFLEHSTEYAFFNPWYRAFLAGLNRRDVYLAIGPGTGSTTGLVDELFTGGFGVEPTADLYPSLSKSCPKMKIIPGAFEGGVSLPELRKAGVGKVSLVEAIHVGYYMTPDQIERAIETCLELLHTDCPMVTVLQHEESDYAKMYRWFVNRDYGLSTVMKKVARKHRCYLEAFPLGGEVALGNEEQALAVARFMLSYVKFSPLPDEADLRRYVNTHFRKETGLYVTSNPQQVMVLRA